MDGSAQSAKLAKHPLRILHVVDSLNVGGTETQVVQVARRMHTTGHQVKVACLRKQGPLLAELSSAGIPVEEFAPGHSLFSLAGFRQMIRMVRYLRRERFHVVHTHDLWSNLLGVSAAWLVGVPVIVSSRRDLGHLPWYTPFRARVLRAIQSLSHRVVVNSRAVREFLIQEQGFRPEHIEVVYNAVDFDRFARAHGERCRVLAGVEEHHRLVVTVANLWSDVKGHADLVEAAPEVCRRIPSVRFVLVGEGTMIPELVRRAQELGVDRHFLFPGRREDVPEILSCCEAFVLPSHAEGFPNAILEAQAAGLPVIATNVGGTPELVLDGKSGILVPPQNPAALAQAILRVLEDRPLAERLGREGQRVAVEEFSFARLLERLETLYFGHLGLGHRRPPS